MERISIDVWLGNDHLSTGDKPLLTWGNPCGHSSSCKERKFSLNPLRANIWNCGHTRVAHFDDGMAAHMRWWRWDSTRLCYSGWTPEERYDVNLSTFLCRLFIFELYRVSLNVHAVLLHKGKHLKGETFVMVWVLKSRGGIHWHHFGQVMVITVGTPGAREKLESRREERYMTRQLTKPNTHSQEDPIVESCEDLGLMWPSSAPGWGRCLGQIFPPGLPGQRFPLSAVWWSDTLLVCRRNCRLPLLQESLASARYFIVTHHLCLCCSPSLHPFEWHSPLPSFSSTVRGPVAAMGIGGGRSLTSMIRASTAVPEYRHWNSSLKKQKIRPQILQWTKKKRVQFNTHSKWLSLVIDPLGPIPTSYEEDMWFS